MESLSDLDHSTVHIWQIIVHTITSMQQLIPMETDIIDLVSYC